MINFLVLDTVCVLSLPGLVFAILAAVLWDHTKLVASKIPVICWEACCPPHTTGPSISRSLNITFDMIPIILNPACLGAPMVAVNHS